MTKLTLREEWEAWIANFRASGMTAKAWCSKHQLKIHQLWYWVRKIESPRLSIPSGKTLSPQWVRLPMEDESSHDALTLIVGNVVLEVKPGFEDAEYLSIGERDDRSHPTLVGLITLKF